jgi:hypothetical protein
MENSMEEDLWENMTEMGRQQQKGLLIAAECKRWRKLTGDRNIWR